MAPGAQDVWKYVIVLGAAGATRRQGDVCADLGKLVSRAKKVNIDHWFCSFPRIFAKCWWKN